MSQVGNFFEDFAPGQVIRHALGRTVTDADNIWFTGITHNPNQVHFNADYAAHSRAAFEVAAEFFEATKVIGSLLERAGV